MNGADSNLYFGDLNNRYERHLEKYFAMKALYRMNTSLVEHLYQEAPDPGPKILVEYPFLISLESLGFDASSWDRYFPLVGTVSTVLRTMEICDVVRVEKG